MFTRKSLGLGVATVGVLGAAVAAFASPAAASVQQASSPTVTVKLGRIATLDAAGDATFSTPVRVSCPAGHQVQFNVSVDQLVDGRHVLAGSLMNITCTGGRQDFRVTVVPGFATDPLRGGIADAAAFVNDCTAGLCTQAVDEHKVLLLQR